jgi:hypothetical protein
MINQVNECECRSELTQQIESQLLQLYGSPIVSGEDLKAALAYNSIDAMRKAISRKKIPVPLFEMENRRGQFALVKDIAIYLAKMRCYH